MEDSSEVYFCGIDDSQDVLQLVFSSDPDVKCYNFYDDLQQKSHQHQEDINVCGVQQSADKTFKDKHEVWDEFEDSFTDLSTAVPLVILNMRTNE